MLRGGDELLEHACQRSGIEPGQTTADGKLTVEFAECLGICDFAPAALADDGRIFGPLDEAKVDAMIDELKQGRGRPDRSEHRRAARRRTLDRRSTQETIRPWPTFEPVLSRNWNVPDGHTLKVYESRGGYQAARKALTTMDPDKVVDVVKDSELRGRGGAGFPCGLKWSFLPKDRKETLMCVNADESEPATFNNRLLMEKDPHQFLEGILIACFATKATTAYVYLRFEYIHAYRILEAAIAEARAAGHLGKNIYGSGFDLDVWLPPRGRGLHLRRGDRADREPRRQAGLAADQAAVPGRSRGRSASRRSSTTSRRSAASRTSSSGGPTGSSRSARPRATARSCTASRATSTSRSASSCRWASPAAS